jgi:hypothetical protein
MKTRTVDMPSAPFASNTPDADPETGPATAGQARLIWSTLSGVGVASALSATATMDEKRYAWLTGAGLDPGVVSVILHGAPVLATALVIPGVMQAMRAKPRGHRIAAYGVAGMVVGVITAICLNLFDGFVPLLEQGLGPLPAPGFWDQIGWILAVMNLFQAGIMAILAIFGAPAMRALSDSADPSCAELQRGDRTTFGWAAVGLVGHGLVAGGLAALHQAVDPSSNASLLVGGVIAAGAGLYGLSNWRLWVRYDELFRRLVVEAMAWSCAAVTALALVWAGLEGAGIGVPLTAYALVMIMLATQLVAVTVLTLRISLAGGR